MYYSEFGAPYSSYSVSVYGMNHGYERRENSVKRRERRNMDNQEIKQRLNNIRELRQHALKEHGYDFCDDPLYDEMLARENELLDELMKEEPSTVSEEMFKSRW